MSEKKTCGNCAHWQPRYFEVGRCAAEGTPNAKMWVIDDKQLLTVISFGCVAFTPKADPAKEMI